MGLPSQSTRSNRYAARRPSRGVRRRRGRRGGGRRILAIVILLVIVATAVIYWPFGGSTPDSANAANGTPPDDNTVAANTGAADPLDRPIPGRDTNRTSRNETSPQNDTNGATRRLELTGSTPTRNDTETNASKPETTKPAEPERTVAPPPKIVNEPRTTQNETRADAVATLLRAGETAFDSGDLILARDLWNRALHDLRATDSDQNLLRSRLSEISDELIFSRRDDDADPVTGSYVIQSGDSLSKVVAKNDLEVDWRLLMRLNDISDPRRIQVGQRIKYVEGPFHAVVSKRDYRLDLYANATDADGNWLFIRSFPVGLGEDDVTPIGRWRVNSKSRLVNPDWVNPRTGEAFDKNNPENPIGERWIGLVGTDENTSRMSGYGIHGTVEPDSIGRQESMGCVRMLPDDIEVIYEFLASDDSVVIITP